MSETFEQLLEESLAKTNLKNGAMIEAEIIGIEPDWVTVSAGLKSESSIPANEFAGEEIKIGDVIDVVVKSAANAFGETQLSYMEGKRQKAWKSLAKYHEANETIMGKIIERVKGGFTVEVENIRAFLPGSLVDIKPVRDPGYLEGKELEFKIIKMDAKRNNIVVSRRAVLEAETTAERSARLDQLQEGQEVKGIVKNITDYGAFIDLGGVDGLLHITDMAWKRVKHPSELLNVGDELRVKILKFDRDKNRVSLGMKQLGEDPWENIARRYPVDTRVFGKITNITDYGCFVELEEGVEGLVHMSELDWTNKNIHPSKVVKSGDEVEVLVLDIDQDRRRISLGIKQCKSNPWVEFAEKHETSEKVVGKIRSITDFGMFIGLEGDIDGLVHLSDISWTEPGEQAVRNYKKGDEVEAIILAIDPERERISLGIKQLQEDPMAELMQGLKDQVVKAKVLKVEAKVAELQLTDDVQGIMKVAEFSHEKTKSLTDELKEGEELEVKVIGVDPKTHQVLASRKALSEAPADKAAAMKKAVGEEPTKTTLGDLLKEQMKSKEE
jgi:small subunit ribosomal protein S1